MKKSDVIYGCEQKVLYASGRLAWKFCLAYLTVFQAFKSFYTDTYIAAMLLLIDDAEAMPSSKVRTEQKSSIRTPLITASDAVLANSQLLKSYIESAFPKDEWATKFQGAGTTYYARGRSDNWAAVKNVISDGNDFIELYLKDLTAKNNMPPDFQNKFAAAGADFNKLADIYAQAYPTMTKGTQTKQQANNALYTAMIAMCKDGKLLYSKPQDKAIKEQFTFSKLKKMVGQGGVSGARGLITIVGLIPAKGQPGVNVTAGDKTTISNAKGRYTIKQLQDGEIPVTFEKLGCVTQVKLCKIKKGVISTFNVQLQPL